MVHSLKTEGRMPSGVQGVLLIKKVFSRIENTRIHAQSEGKYCFEKPSFTLNIQGFDINLISYID